MSDELYDEWTQFWLRQRPMDHEDELDLPVVAYLCNRCAAVVVDQPVHDRFHDTLERK